MSFNTGLSGLRAAQMDLSVVGNNIANASTKGFKQSRAEFGDVYSASILGTGKNSVGSGVLVERVSQQHTQGNIDYTDRALDMAIEGNGYFMLSNNGQIEYTRAGYFDLDKDGFIVNNTGKRLQGYEADLQGNIMGGQPGDIRLSQANIEPNATSRVDLELNLDSRKDDLNLALFDPRDRTTYSDVNQTSVFDSLGIEHTLSQFYIKVTAAQPDDGNTWAVLNSFDGQFFGNNGTPIYIENGAGNWEPLTAVNWDPANDISFDGGTNTFGDLGTYLANSAGVDTATPPNPVAVPAEGLVQSTLFFNTQGSLEGFKDGYDVSAGFPNVVPYNFNIPSDYLAGAWMGSSQGSGNQIIYNLRGTTQYGASYSAQSQSQDGYTTGRLSGLEVEADGTIFGRYTNGQNRSVGQVPIITFRSPENLKPNGSTGWLETAESGVPTINKAGTGITGTIAGGALEDSNVDLAEELVKMIIGQRNYQANAKTIQTQDTITQTIINLR